MANPSSMTLDENTFSKMNFADKIRVTSEEKKAQIDAVVQEKLRLRNEEQLARSDDVRTQLFKDLTNKYHDTIRRGIGNAANNGKREKYINFARDDFKANCHGVGFPQEVQAAWLNEMCNPLSDFLPLATESSEWWSVGEKMHFHGVTFNVWNNKAFTVHFSW